MPKRSPEQIQGCTKTSIIVNSCLRQEPNMVGRKDPVLWTEYITWCCCCCVLGQHSVPCRSQLSISALAGSWWCLCKRTPSQNSCKFTPSCSTEVGTRGHFHGGHKPMPLLGVGYMNSPPIRTHPVDSTDHRPGGWGYFVFIFYLSLFART